MADIPLTSVAGVGVSEISFFSGTLQVPTATSGNLFVITPPAGKRVTLNSFVPGGTETLITISGNKVGAVINALTASAVASSAGSFLIIGAFSTNPANNAGYSSPLTFAIDEVVTASKGGSATVGVTYYSYSYGS